MIRVLARAFFSGLLFLALVTVSLADDWTAVRLRGAVFVLTSGEWVELNRGDIVSDDSLIRTERGRARFERDGEAIDVAPNTQLKIIDQTGRRFTTVVQDYGKVTIQAEVQNVEHFSVETPYLAAVVKGTKFSVTTSDSASTVKVRRGQVAVEGTATSDSVTVLAGQSVSVTADAGTMEVTGRGAMPAAVPRKGPLIGQEAPTNASPNDGNNDSGESTQSAASESSSPSVSSSGADSTPASSPEPSSPGQSSPPPQDNGNNGNHHGHDNPPGSSANDNSGPGNNNGDHGNHHGQNKDHANNGNHTGHDKNGKKD